MTLWNFSIKNDEGQITLLVGDDNELVADLIIENGDQLPRHSMFVNESELRGLAANAQFMADYLTTKRCKQSREGAK